MGPLSIQTLNICKVFVLVVLCLSPKIHSPLLCLAQRPRRLTTNGCVPQTLASWHLVGFVQWEVLTETRAERERVQGPSCLLSPDWPLVSGRSCSPPPHKPSLQLQPSQGSSPNLGEVIFLAAHLWGPQHLLCSLNPAHTCLSSPFNGTTQDYFLPEAS